VSRVAEIALSPISAYLRDPDGRLVELAHE
jgi:hypothetical protein